MKERETIFISHSSTVEEDNYFASWLAAKLKGLGYKVWVDINDLKGGGSFWPNIENEIRDKSIRFLSCISESYIEKARTPKTGVQKELSCASNVDIDAFMIPLRIDNSNWSNLPIHINELNGIDFYSNWASGLNELIDLFNEDNIPQNNKKDDILDFWYKSREISTDVVEREERYFTNWVKILLPQKIYIHKINKADLQDLSQFPFPYYQDKDLIISFFDERVIKNSVPPRATYEFKFDDFIEHEKIKLTKRTTLASPRKKVIALLNELFHIYLLDKPVFQYEFSNKTSYFFNSEKQNVSLKHLGKTRKSISGYSSGYSWYYGISFFAALNPFPHYKIYHHVVFKDSENKLVDQTLQHKLRRSTCSNWYNRDWLERLMAWFTNLADFDEEISVHVDLDCTVCVDSIPHKVYSPVGYKEPN